MCSSDEVAAPSTWHDGVMPDAVADALAQAQGAPADISSDAAEALRIPLSLSDPRNDLDKHGQACTVFDCVFSTTVMAEAARLRAMKVFAIETVIGWINHKHGTGLDQRYKLPKLRYKGDTVQSHRIRKDRKQLVTEITEVDDVDDAPALPLRSAPVPADKRARPRGMCRRSSVQAPHSARYSSSQRLLSVCKRALQHSAMLGEVPLLASTVGCAKHHSCKVVQVLRQSPSSRHAKRMQIRAGRRRRRSVDRRLITLAIYKLQRAQRQRPTGRPCWALPTRASLARTSACRCLFRPVRDGHGATSLFKRAWTCCTSVLRAAHL